MFNRIKINKHGGQSGERIYSAKTVYGRGLLEMSSQKIKEARTDPKLYPVVVTDMDKIGKIGKRMKIHYVGYSEQYD